MSKLFQSQSIIVGYGHSRASAEHPSWEENIEELVERSIDVSRIGGYKLGPVFNGRHGMILSRLKTLTDKPVLYEPQKNKLDLTKSDLESIDGLVLNPDQSRNEKLVTKCQKKNVEPVVELQKNDFFSWKDIVSESLSGYRRLDHFLLHHKKTSFLEDGTFLKSCTDIFRDYLKISRPTLIIDLNSPNMDIEKIREAAEGTNWHLIVREKNLSSEKQLRSRPLEDISSQIEVPS